VETIIRRRTAEGTQQCNIVASRSQACTETDEGHRVGLGAAHGGHQDIVAQRGLDQQRAHREEIERTRDERHATSAMISFSLSSAYRARQPRARARARTHAICPSFPYVALILSRIRDEREPQSANQRLNEEGR